MGTGHSARRVSFDASGEVNFDHFQILRAIGKGSFGKVCIVQKKDTKKMFAMKYMNKAICAGQSAIDNVIRELNMLTRLDHPFLVNLWYAFQDEEDMFMVVDLLLGGDLRYHMQQEVKLSEDCIRLYMAELGLALDYLHTHRIVHRDIKPDNILLDEQGHCHVTDFNIAAQLNEDELATSTSGTRPYMAPEVYGTAINERRGYTFPIDWWSLGISIFEIFKNRRPYNIHSNTTNHDVWNMMLAARGQPVPIHQASDELKDLLRLLLEFDPHERLCSLARLKEHKFMACINFDEVLSLSITPPFIPSKEHLNCDPTYELEEMIIETKPLHKKKKRLAKQNSRQSTEGDSELDDLTKMFKYYNKDTDRFQRSLSTTCQKTVSTTCQSPSTVKERKMTEVDTDSHCVDPDLDVSPDKLMHLQEGPTVITPKSVNVTLPDAVNASARSGKISVTADYTKDHTEDRQKKKSTVYGHSSTDSHKRQDGSMKGDQPLASALFTNVGNSSDISAYSCTEEQIVQSQQSYDINASSPFGPVT